jgi:transcriptional regulator GlxA family with amidase domain
MAPKGERNKSSLPLDVFAQTDARVRVVARSMEQFPARQHKIASLSKSVNLSPSRLGELFRKATGRSPIQYLRNIRIRHAEQLLRTTFLSIKEVAFRSGISDVSHFVRDFKRLYGFTPTEFRSRQASATEALVASIDDSANKSPDSLRKSARH